MGTAAKWLAGASRQVQCYFSMNVIIWSIHGS